MFRVNWISLYKRDFGYFGHISEIKGPNLMVFAMVINNSMSKMKNNFKYFFSIGVLYFDLHCMSMFVFSIRKKTERKKRIKER